MNRKTIYIAGPMAGIPDLNYSAFSACEDKLRKEGWAVVNPFAFSAAFGDAPSGKMLDACCKSELAAIPFLDAIFLLPGWEKSKGAKAELAVALAHGLQVVVGGDR